MIKSITIKKGCRALYTGKRFKGKEVNVSITRIERLSQYLESVGNYVDEISSDHCYGGTAIFQVQTNGGETALCELDDLIVCE